MLDESGSLPSQQVVKGRGLHPHLNSLPLRERNFFLAAKPDDLSKIIDFRKVGAFHKAVIGEVDPGLAIQGTELI